MFQVIDFGGRLWGIFTFIQVSASLLHDATIYQHLVCIYLAHAKHKNARLTCL